MKRPQGSVNARAAINKIKLDSLPSLVYTGAHEIIPYGMDNLYPTRVVTALKKSPTALGCLKRQSEFIFGYGSIQNPVVNRDGETLNDIIWQVIRHGYCPLYGFGLHFNFNVLGQISEIFFVNPEYIRKLRDMKHVIYGVWDVFYGAFFEQNFVEIDNYDRNTLRSSIIAAGGIEQYKGQCYYFSRDKEIYPTSPFDSAIVSAEYEREAQIYPYANIKNGFSGNTIVKYPTMEQGENAEKEADDIVKKIESIHGSENAGSSVVLSFPLNTAGDAKPFQMVEHLSPTNVDGLFVNQNRQAERSILKQVNMPEILLGISSQGMFNEASFNDAFDYKNSDTEADRKMIEREFNKFMPFSVWQIDNVELVPLKMKKTKDNGI